MTKEFAMVAMSDAGDINVMDMLLLMAQAGEELVSRDHDIRSALTKFEDDPTTLSGEERRLIGLAVCHGMSCALLASNGKGGK